MSTPLTDDEIREQAYRDVTRKMGWLADFTAYLLVNFSLVAVWMMTGRGYPWFAWGFGVWGAALVLHFVLVFVRKRPGGARLSDADEPQGPAGVER